MNEGTHLLFTLGGPMTASFLQKVAVDEVLQTKTELVCPKNSHLTLIYDIYCKTSERLLQNR